MGLEKPLILFDGVCNLCSASVQFIIRHDPKAKFLFAALQSPLAQTILEKQALSPTDYDTVILFANEQVFSHSTAVLKIARELEHGWSLFAVLLWVPKPIRDWGYRLIAKNRYTVFGKQAVCWLPTPELSNRFISS